MTIIYALEDIDSHVDLVTYPSDSEGCRLQAALANCFGAEG
jgi:hypothetical protein